MKHQEKTEQGECDEATGKRNPNSCKTAIERNGVVVRCDGNGRLGGGACSNREFTDARGSRAFSSSALYRQPANGEDHRLAASHQLECAAEDR
jgi:hypothetical protein